MAEEQRILQRSVCSVSFLIIDLTMNSATNTAGISISIIQPKTSILDKPINTKVKHDISINLYALLFSELVQYCQNKSLSVPEFQSKLHEVGQSIGAKLIDINFYREKNGKREIKLLNILQFVKINLWKNIFGKECDKLERANDDERTYYLIEQESLVNKFISVPKDKGSLNCAIFVAGIVEAVLNNCGFKSTVTAHWHKGTTYMIQFDEQVIARDK
ncbi:trafficking protein particle complex subunit 5-like isoform X1 [Diaphorina citri]|uniref:Trafficking protein particle complex subunit 5 n=2 Tax=Diaphorina citri TaxID=121845 RepID=A0A1S3CVT8_DIACI|nr:trafficking protein particle complex subunit 5-like isoform X1 [Diaphorina citri]